MISIPRRMRVVFALLSAAITCGCGTGAAGNAQPTAAQPSVYAEPLDQPWPIAAVARTADPRVVSVTIAGVPLPSAPGLCHADVSYELAEAPLTVGVGIHVLSRLTSFGRCATGTRRILVRLASPLGRRDVFASNRVTPAGGRFIAVGNSYQECRPPDCNPMYQPVIPDCMHLREAIAGSDVPAHFRFDGPCRPPFAAVVVDVGAGSCPVSDESNSCAGKRLTRQFWFSDGKFWKLVLQGDHATCVDAHKALATFPTSLCSDPQWIGALHR